MRHLHDERHFAESHLPRSRESGAIFRELAERKQAGVVIGLPFAYALRELVVPVVETRYGLAGRIHINLFSDILTYQNETKYFCREKIGHLSCRGAPTF